MHSAESGRFPGTCDHGEMTEIDETAAAGDDLLDELQSWLEDNWDPDLSVGEWWQRLGLAGWAAPGLPLSAYGRGRRSQRLGPRPERDRRVRRTRCAGWARPAAGGADHRHPRHPGADRPLRARHRHRGEGVVPALQRAGRRFGPGRLDDAGRARRRRMDRQRPEGVDHVRPHRRPGDAHRPHRSRRAQAPGHHVVRSRHAPARRRGPSPDRDDGTRPVQRGVPDRRPGARLPPSSAIATTGGPSPTRRSCTNVPASGPAADLRPAGW